MARRLHGGASRYTESSTPGLPLSRGPPASSRSALLTRSQRHTIRSVVLTGGLLFLVLATLRHFSDGHSGYKSWISISRRPRTAHRPGRYGRWLAQLHERAKGADVPSDELGPSAQLFELMVERDEASCAGWTPELSRVDRRWHACWRARIWKQVDEFNLPGSFENEVGMREHNEAALQRLQRCVAQPILYDTPQDDPTYEPLGRRRETAQDVRNTPCSLTATKVVLGHWWYFTCSVLNLDTSGEVIWLKSQVQALRELGYTVIFTSSYEGMVQAHNAMPDVISHIWTEDKFVMTCLGDPRCMRWSDFQAHDITYPALGIDEAGKAIWPSGVVPNDQGHTDRQKWMWTRAELDGIPEDQRGMIPRHKLFATTYWGSRPGGMWSLADDGLFAFNALGQEWTLSPFDYPKHSHFPYTVEDTVMAIPYVPPSERADRSFVLAKRFDYFWNWASVAPGFWVNAKEKTGLDVISTAVLDAQPEPGGTRLPDGVPTLGRLKPLQFAAEMAKSRVMLGIGRPEMSPSVYHALGMGTPVVLPYYVDGQPIPTGWARFYGDKHQHGPASVYGPPYVYSYRAQNETDMVEKIKQAASTPIERFIDPKMTWQAVLSNMDDYMRFDWAAHGRVNEADLQSRMTEVHVWTFGRCFEIGQCRPLKDGP